MRLRSSLPAPVGAWQSPNYHPAGQQAGPAAHLFSTSGFQPPVRNRCGQQISLLVGIVCELSRDPFIAIVSLSAGPFPSHCIACVRLWSVDWMTGVGFTPQLNSRLSPRSGVRPRVVHSQGCPLRPSGHSGYQYDSSSSISSSPSRTERSLISACWSRLLVPSGAKG